MFLIESLGKEIGMSRTAFATRFTKLVGEPMLQYLTKWRMNLAVMRLKDGEKVTPELIEQPGYKSESAFTHQYSLKAYPLPSQAAHPSVSSVSLHSAVQLIKMADFVRSYHKILPHQLTAKHL